MHIKPIIFLTLLLSGCIALNRSPGFEDIKESSKSILNKEVHWYQGSAADQEVDNAIQKLLQKKLTAPDAVQIALLRNSNLQAAYEDLNIAQADLVAAGLLSNPVFNAEIRFSDAGTGIETGLVQGFIDLLFLGLRKKAAASAFEASKLKTLKKIVDLAAEVEGEFYNYLALQEALKLKERNYEVQGARLVLFEELRKAGNVRSLELAKEGAAKEEARIELRKARAEVERSRQRLNKLMGVAGDSWVAEDKAYDFKEPSKTKLNSLKEIALERSLDLGILKSEINRASAVLEASGPLATFGGSEIGVSGERSDESGHWGVGPSFSLPLPLINQGQPAVARAQAALNSKHQRYLWTVNTIRAAAASRFETLQALNDELAYFKNTLLPLRKKIVKETQLLYNAMQAGPETLLSAKRDEIEAYERYARSLGEWGAATARLNQLLNGSLGSEGLTVELSNE